MYRIHLILIYNHLPEKDFKAVIDDWLIKKIGIEFFENALTAMPLYKLNKKDWIIWLNNIIKFCEHGKTKVYVMDLIERSQVVKIVKNDILYLKGK